MTEDSRAPGAAMDEELRSQSATWRRAIDLAPTLADVLPRRDERVLAVGCGTSWFMAQAYAGLRTDAGQGRTRAAVPSEVDWIDDDDYLLVISRSGTTADAIDFVERHADGHRVGLLIGDQASPLGSRPDAVDLAFADERSVVQTRFATTGLALLRASLRLVPPTLLEDARAATAAPLPVEDLESVRHIVFLGHRWTVGLAQESALKLREAAAMWTEAYPVMEYQHGPIACAGPGTLVWSFEPVPPLLEAAILATGARLHVPAVDPQAAMITVHRLALALALAAGRDPDRPPHLTRAVETV